MVLIPAGFILTDERELKCYLSSFHCEKGLNNIFLCKGEIKVAIQKNSACVAVDHKTVSLKENEAPRSEEITVTIKNGTVVKFVQNVYYASLEGVNGDGI